jgi:hypothetical protein
MPALSGRGPFSYDTITLSGTNVYTLVNATYDPTNGETLEVLVAGTKLQGVGLSIAGTIISGDGFYVNSLTNPTTISLTPSASTAEVVIRRISNRSTPQVDFAPGSVIRESDLDDSTNQTLHVAQEAMDIAISGMVLEANDKFNGKSKVIESVANPVAANDVVTKTYLEDTWLTSTDKTNSATVAGISAHVTTVAGISANVTAVAGDATDIGVVAGKATEIGRLGTADTVADMVLLGTTDCIADMAILGTSDIVADMALLGTSDCVADMAILGTSDVVTDMNVLATSDVVTDMNTLGTADVVADMNVLGTSDVVTDMNLLATADVVADMALLAVPAVITDMDLLGATGVIADMDAIGATGVIGDIETVADNLAGVTAFAARYRVASSAPGSDNDDGDLYYNTTSNQLNVHDGSNWGAIGQTEAQTIVTANNAAVAMAIALG